MYYHVYLYDYYHTTERVAYDIPDLEHIKQNVVLPYLKQEHFFFNGEEVDASWFTKIIIKATYTKIKTFVSRNRLEIPMGSDDYEHMSLFKHHFSSATDLTDSLLIECRNIVAEDKPEVDGKTNQETEKIIEPVEEFPMAYSTEIITPETEPILPKKKFHRSGTFWGIAGVIVTILCTGITLKCSSDKSNNYDPLTANITENYNEPLPKTLINQSLVGAANFDSQNLYKLAKEINLNMSLNYVLQGVGMPPVQYMSEIGTPDTVKIEYLIYQCDKFCLKIGTIDGINITNLTVLGIDTTYNISLNKTPITIGTTTFGDMRYNGNLSRSVGNKYAGIETQGGIYMANPGNYWYADVGIYCGVGPETEKFGKYLFIDFEENPDFSVPVIYYNDIKINWASIAKEPQYLTSFWYEDFTDIYL